MERQFFPGFQTPSGLPFFRAGLLICRQAAENAEVKAKKS
jgi:hypothetical protein